MEQIIIEDVETLRKAIAFARSEGCYEQFAQTFVNMLSLIASSINIEQWHHWGNKIRPETATAHIASDFAPMSFRFYSVATINGVAGRENLIMNGGLIYHGPADDGSGAANPDDGVIGQDTSSMRSPRSLAGMLHGDATPQRCPQRPVRQAVDGPCRSPDWTGVSAAIPSLTRCQGSLPPPTLASPPRMRAV